MEYELGQKVWRFHGGVRLRHYKKMAVEQPLATAAVPPVLRLPLNQHKGALAEPSVAVGDAVQRGQPIAASPQPFEVQLHAPWGGRVTAIDDFPVIGRREPVKCIVIETDPQDVNQVRLPGLSPWREQSAARIAERAGEAGIVGLGGALFPTQVKLGATRPIKMVLINGAECEPYIACDEIVMRTRADALVEGAQIAAHAAAAGSDPPLAVIAIEDQMGVVERILREARERLDAEEVEIFKVPTIYPEGGERQLIQVLTGQEVPAGGLPLDLGILVLNVNTVVALRHAVVDGTPLVSRVVTVTGAGVKQPQNFEALLGTPAGELIAQAGGYTDGVKRLVMGGPMMGVALADDSLPITKATNCLLALVESDVQRTEPERPCIRCMECVRVCPAQLLPHFLMMEIAAENHDEVRALSLDACIECGCCAYVCPSQIPLVDYYRYGKSQLAIVADEQGRARHHRLRFEEREARLAREAEREAQALQAREQELTSKSDAIQAAIERARKKKS